MVKVTRCNINPCAGNLFMREIGNHDKKNTNYSKIYNSQHKTCIRNMNGK